MTELAALLEELRAGERPRLDRRRIEALLAWLNGAATRHGEENLPQAGHDPVLLQMVFYRLDDALFRNSELDADAAGVGTEVPAGRRRKRFRRLAGAFHPDRFPDLADWLTTRSQAIHRAYSRFKHDEEAAPTGPRQTAATGVAPAGSPGYGYAEPRRSPFRFIAEALRTRFGRDRYLAHKLIGALAILAMLPVANLMLVPDPRKALEESASPDSLADPGAISGSPARQASTDSGPATGPAGEQPVAENGKRQTESPGPTPATGDDARGPAVGDADPPKERAGDISPLLAAARRAMNPDSDGVSPPGTRPSVDQQLAAMGLETDAERLYRRMLAEERARSQTSPAPAAESARRADAGAGAGEDPTAEHRNPNAENAPTASDRPRGNRGDWPARIPPAEGAPASADRAPSRPMRRIHPGSGIVPSVRSIGNRTGGNGAETTPSADSRADSARREQPAADTDSGARAGPAGQDPNAEIRKRETGNPSGLPSGELILGPLASHPAGRLLARFHEDLEAGNATAAASRFTHDGRLGSRVGQAEIAEFFAGLFAGTAARRATLKLLRMERDGYDWEIEAALEIEVRHDGRTSVVQRGRSRFRLEPRGGSFAIASLEP